MKQGVQDALNAILAPIRASYESNKEWKATAELAYPSEGPKKVKKKEKKIGSGYVSKEKKNVAVAENVADGEVNPQDVVSVNVKNALNKLSLDAKTGK